VDLSKLLLAEDVRTMDDVGYLLAGLPREALLVIDSMDTMPIGAGRRLTTEKQGVSSALQELAAFAPLLQSRQISVILISQIRYRPATGLQSSAGAMEGALTAALNLRVLSRETKYGERTWTQIAVENTRHTLNPPGRECILYMHPSLGISPERELVEELKKRYGTKWRSELTGRTGVRLPNGLVAAAQAIRDNPETAEKLWRLLWQRRKSK